MLNKRNNIFLALIVAVQLKKFEFVESAAYPVSRIVGGVPADIKEFPYVVGIVEGVYFCGGSLITSHCVLTAAHCVYGSQASDLEIFAGSTPRASGIYRRVKQFFVPKSYRWNSVDMDVAVIQLSSPLHSELTKSIDIDYTPLRKGDTILAAGWGSTRDGGMITGHLRSVRLTVLSDTECKKKWSWADITSNMFCAHDRGKDTCQGDSGGPTVRNGKQVGIVSWGGECASATYPGVYTKLSSNEVKSFLSSTIKKYCS